LESMGRAAEARRMVRRVMYVLGSNMKLKPTFDGARRPRRA
jgi:hypothetical protein